VLKCKLYKNCQFYRRGFAAMPSTSKFLRKNYCLGDSSDCARFLIATNIGMEKVPDYICPNSFDMLDKSMRDLYLQGIFK
jgi:hypothetical protein